MPMQLVQRYEVVDRYYSRLSYFLRSKNDVVRRDVSQRDWCHVYGILQELVDEVLEIERRSSNDSN